MRNHRGPTEAHGTWLRPCATRGAEDTVVAPATSAEEVPPTASAATRTAAEATVENRVRVRMTPPLWSSPDAALLCRRRTLSEASSARLVSSGRPCRIGLAETMLRRCFLR